MTAQPARLAKGLSTLLGTGLLLGGCAPSGNQAEVYARSVAGCYQFDAEPADARLGLPWGIELREEPLTGWPGHEASYLARTWLTPEDVEDHPFGYWTQASADSLRTGYPAGGGLDLSLAPGDGILAGWGRAVGDAVFPGDSAGPRPWYPVLARRIACPDR